MTKERYVKSLAGRLSESSNRAYVHALVLLGAAVMVLVAGLSWGVFFDIERMTDKSMHYHAGRIIAAVSFFCAYLFIIARILIVGRSGGSITKALLWIPALVALGMMVSMLITCIFAVGKEVLDIGGGNVEWLDIDATFEGALTMAIPVAVIMALTPLLIPMDMLMQLPRLMLIDMRTGIGQLDNYAREQKSHSKSGKAAEVLVVEDDIVCATTIMNFCRNVGLTCHHVSSIAAAEDYLYEHLAHIRLVALDNFLRVDADGNNMTGGEWLADLCRRDFPPGNRSFLVVIISGHPEFIGDNKELADLVLKKPWKPRELLAFLKKEQLLA
ncbi:MAG: hypothetical protein GY868_02730 [Deltaproteobacteria bacterium]|nr:hypothetical protein [Deltaproteobacteria bacterium]